MARPGLNDTSHIEEEVIAPMRTSKRLSKSIVLFLVIVFTLAAVTGCSGAKKGVTAKPSKGQSASAAKPDKVRVAYYTMPYLSLVIKSKGWLEKELGVPVEWKEFDGGAQVEQALAAGEVDFAVGIGSSPVAAGIANGIDQYIVWIAEDIGDNEALVVKSSIKSVKDLEGKKIAVPFVSTSHFAFLGALELAGVDPAKVQILDMVPKDFPAAFERGDIDGGWVWHPALGQLVKEGGRVIATNGEVSKQGYVTWDNGIVSKQFADEYPDVVTSFIKIQQKAVDFYETDTDETVAIVAGQTGQSDADTKLQLAGFVFPSAEEQLGPDWLGTSSQPGRLPQQLLKISRFLVEQKKIQNAPSDFSPYVQPKFVERALGR